VSWTSGPQSGGDFGTEMLGEQIAQEAADYLQQVNDQADDAPESAS
jgi:hypothetical protein